MTAFDPIRSAHEELSGLSDVHRVLMRSERRAEEAMALAESELNAIRKINGFVRVTMDAMRQRINELEKASVSAK